MKVIAVYIGRFQPFHKGHNAAYTSLVERFGEDNVFIGTSGVTDPKTSPFTFAEKEHIMTGMFNIPSQNIVKVKNPYRPEEILKKFDPNNTAFVTAVGMKDSSRLQHGKYFQSLDDREGNDMVPYSKNGYYIRIPNYKIGEKVLSSTQIRDILGNPNIDPKKKIDFFKDVYGKFDRRFFEMMRDTITAARNKEEEEEDQSDDKFPQDKEDDKEFGADDDEFDREDQPEKGQSAREPRPDSESPEDAAKEDPSINTNAGLLDKTVRNPRTRRDIKVRTALNYPHEHPVYQIASKMFKNGKTNEIFEGVLLENALINQYNDIIDRFIVGNEQKDALRILPTDTPEEMQDKCKTAYKQGAFYFPLAHALSLYAETGDSKDVGSDTGATTPADNSGKFKSSPMAGASPGRAVTAYSQPDAGNSTISDQNEAKSSTERVRKYYRKHPEKVRAYLKKTVKDRVARNRDRKKAVKKYGKSKMKNHDVHHPNGAQGGNWRLARKDHGRDRKNEITEEDLTEGGAAGHMMHPYEDKKLTFSDYKEMIERGLVGSLGTEEPVTEKLDGRNIAFTMKDGEIRFARNKGHIKNAGEKSMDIVAMSKKFETHEPDAKRAFVGAARDLKDAMKHIDKEQLSSIFNDGKNFMSVEIILPDSQNIIPYGKSVLVFHGSIEYDDDGNPIGVNRESAKVLNDKIIEVGQERQSMFGIQGPNIIAFNDPDISKQTAIMHKFNSEIDRLRDEFELDDNSPISDYYSQWWTREINKEAAQSDIKLPDTIVKGLVNRWAFGDKSGVKLNKELSPEIRDFIKTYEANNLKRTQKVVQQPFEMLFLRLGASVLERVTNFLAANNPGATDKIRSEVEKTINSIGSDGMSQNKAEKLTQELERLKSIGLDNIVPSEGIVFIYKGSPYKFTGTFAPINKMMGGFTIKQPSDTAKAVAPKPGEADDDGVVKKKALIRQFYNDRVKNPLTGRNITIQSALTYEPSHPARQEAVKYLVTKVGEPASHNLDHNKDKE